MHDVDDAMGFLEITTHDVVESSICSASMSKHTADPGQHLQFAQLHVIARERSFRKFISRQTLMGCSNVFCVSRGSKCPYKILDGSCMVDGWILYGSMESFFLFAGVFTVSMKTSPNEPYA